MWVYEKKLQFPVNIRKPNLKLANAISTQFGGPNGELGAAIRYLTQRINMPTSKSKAVLNDIGTEELAHLEMIQSIIFQLSRDATPEEFKEAGLQGYYAVWDNHIFPQSPSGEAFTTASMSNTSDPVANLHENLAAESKARATYEQILNLTDDPDVTKPINFLRVREVIHFQRFGETLDDIQLHQSMRNQFVVKKDTSL
ncbi:manganese catalase family protein [Mycoplasmatota bacterium]|nr:manganese catalase family protein [Mycoplasmatota bacterium]